MSQIIYLREEPQDISLDVSIKADFKTKLSELHQVSLEVVWAHSGKFPHGDKMNRYRKGDSGIFGLQHTLVLWHKLLDDRCMDMSL